MILPDPKDAIHRMWMFRTLREIYDDAFLASILVFKGGTCAAMRGLLDRFSVDLDFDFIGPEIDMQKVRKKLEDIFEVLGLTIKDQSKKVPQYFLKYPSAKQDHNTLKVDITTIITHTNTYESIVLRDIDRIVRCHTIESMFANKLVALLDRYEKHHSIAARDIYDIHHFFMQGYRYSENIITERRETDIQTFLREIISFIQKNVTASIIDQDLNTLLEPKQFKREPVAKCVRQGIRRAKTGVY